MCAAIHKHIGGVGCVKDCMLGVHRQNRVSHNQSELENHTKKKILRHSRHLVFTEVLRTLGPTVHPHRHMHVYTETKSLLTAEKSNFPGPLKRPAIQNLKVNPELALLNLEQSTWQQSSNSKCVPWATS